MRKLFTLFIISLVAHVVWGQSGVGYDPENPADPNVYYNLSLEASPSTGGTIDPSSTRSLEAGSGVYCYASAKKGYVFKQWMEGDSVVSTNRNFYYTMPNHDVVLTAYFDYVGYNYDPENPGDPFEDGYKHKVALCSNPKNAGYFNNNDFYLVEGDSINVYAYPNNGFKFESWEKDGITISRSNPLNIKMDSLDLTYTANFIYDPVNPGDPAPNNFNPVTGEVVIDSFTPGYLNSAIGTVVGSENYDLVQSIVVIGKMESYDFGFSYYLSNCALIDLARTTGYTEVPSYSFEGNDALTKVVLPSSVERIGYCAFYGCTNLSEIACYAIVPPVVDSYVFKDVPSGLVVRVPSSAISQYMKSNGWKDFTILPLDEETCTINVSLPTDAIDGRYKNMILELNNISSGQVLKYLITDRVNYKFANIISNTKFNIFVKNPAGIVLGSIMDVEVNDRNVHVEFESLLQTQIVELNILTPDGVDVTSETVITWKDNVYNYLSQGSVLKNVIEGSAVNYSVALSKELGLQYKAPESCNYVVKGSDNTITCQLQPFAEVQVTGFVKDVTTNDAISGAMVTISQQLNGKYSKSQTVYTDKDGAYTATLYVAPTNVTFAANNYLSQSYEITDVTKTESIQTVYLKTITGAIVSANFTYTPSVDEGETSETQDWYDDYANVAYSIYNKTAQKAIKDFKVQGTSIVLLEEVKEGDVLSITASSKNGSFVDVVTEGIVDALNRISVSIPIVELGGIEATYTESGNASNVGVLYDARGTLVKKINYSESGLSISNLSDGDYTLVSMGNSRFFNSVLNLSELDKSGLSEGNDYVINEVKVESGKISKVTVAEIPEFDESKFYYTGANTSFTVNKSSVTVGNYVTLKAKVDFRQEFANAVSDVKLVFDLPEGCSFVENSVLAGAGTGSYLVEDSRITVYMANLSDQVRFCVIPTLGGECKPSAFVQFMLNGEEVMQPIGSAYFNVQYLSIDVPTKTAQESVVISGVAFSNSIVKLYDNGIFVGQTRTTANGSWEMRLDLNSTLSYLEHNIYGVVYTEDGICLQTDTKQMLQNKRTITLSKLTMINGETKMIFDFQNPTKKKLSYSYANINDFSFIVDFTNNSDSLISNVEVNVLASDSRVIEIPAYYNETKKVWMASCNDFSSSSLPTRISVSYDCLDLGIITSPKTYIDYSLSKYLNNSIVDWQIVNKNTQTFKLVNHTTGDTTFNYVFKEHISKRDSVEKKLNNLFTLIYNLEDASVYMGTASMILLKFNNDSLGVYGQFVEGVMDDYYKLNDQDDYLTRCNTKTISSKAIHYEGGAHDQFINDELRPEDEVYYHDCLLCRLRNNRLSRILEIADRKLKCSQTDYNDKQKIKYAISKMRSIVSIMDATLLANVINVTMTASRPDNVIDMSYSLIEAAQNTANFSEDIPGMAKSLEHYVNDILMVKDYCCEPCNDEESLKQSSIRMKSFSYNNRKCDKGKEEEIVSELLEGIIDPSGYVYEAVSTNRLAGVTATAYYKEQVEDMYGDLHYNVVKWDAEEYAQENPLFTDENGMYAWDVPQGLWQVKFEKEGYETAYSEWLPVPPPQLEVNIAMTQLSHPEIKLVHAYSGGVEIEFDKYMLPETLINDNIYVCENGEKVEGQIVFINEELSYKDEIDKYVSKIRFIPASVFSASEIILTISNKVKSYSGIQMQETFTQTFDVEPEISSIEVDSIINVSFGETKVMHIKVLPPQASAGKIVSVKSSSSFIASLYETDVILDKNGEAEIYIIGEMLGTAIIDYKIEDYDIHASSVVKIKLKETNKTANPIASIASGSVVEKGTSVTLECSTPNAVIYYTLDGSCPCDDATRILYDGTPIIINETTTLKIIAYAEGCYESEVVTYNYTVNESIGLDVVTLNGSIRLYPVPVKSVLTISAGGLLLQRVLLLDMSGKCVYRHDETAEQLTLDMSGIPAGIYVAKIETADESCMRKVLKIE